MQGSSAGGDSDGVFATNVIGELLFKLGDERALGDPPGPQGFDDGMFLFASNIGTRHRNYGWCRYGCSTHFALPVVAVSSDLTWSRHAISISRPVSRSMLALNPSMLSAFSVVARRARTLLTLRASWYSGLRLDPVTLSSLRQSSFNVVSTPVPTLKTSSVTSETRTAILARATSS